MRENEKLEAYCDRKNLLREVEDLTRDVREIRTTAKDLELDLRDNRPGSFELVPVTEGITDLQKTTQEAVGALSEHVAGAIGSSSDEIVDALRDGLEMASTRAMRDQEDTRIIFEGLIEEAQETRYVVEDIKSLAKLNLTALGACLAVEVAQGKMLGRIGDTLLDINDAVSDLQVSVDGGFEKVADRITSLEGTTIEVGARISDQIRVSSEHTARATYEVGACLQGTMVNVGDRVCKQIQFSSELVARIVGQNISAIGQHIYAGQVEGTGRVLTALQVMEERAQRRHGELVLAVQSPLANEANEKYAQAMTLFRAGEFGRAVKELRNEVFKRDPTHVPGWILFGHCCESRGRPAEAKSAFRRAATYALICKRMEDFETAIVHLARLEHVVGNVEIAKDTMLEAMASASKAGYEVSPYFRYELFKHEFVHASAGFDKKSRGYRKWLAEQARILRDTLLRPNPELREEVATHPIFADMIRVAPFLGWCNAPYIRLAEFVFDHCPAKGQNRVAPVYKMNPRVRPDCYKCFESFLEILNKVLVMIRGGKIEHPKEIHECLTRIQTLVVAFEEKARGCSQKEREALYVRTMQGLYDGKSYNEFARIFEVVFLFYVGSLEVADKKGEPKFAAKIVGTEEIAKKTIADWRSCAIYSVRVLPRVSVWYFNRIKIDESNAGAVKWFIEIQMPHILKFIAIGLNADLAQGKWPQVARLYQAWQKRCEEEALRKKQEAAKKEAERKEAERQEALRKKQAKELRKKQEEEEKRRRTEVLRQAEAKAAEERREREEYAYWFQRHLEELEVQKKNREAEERKIQAQREYDERQRKRAQRAEERRQAEAKANEELRMRLVAEAAKKAEEKRREKVEAEAKAAKAKKEAEEKAHRQMVGCIWICAFVVGLIFFFVLLAFGSSRFPGY